MSRVVGEWKHYTSRVAGIKWQANFFDHRIRSRFGLAEKNAYILRNPVVKGLCAAESDWPWVWRPPANG
jgi:putative transposase